MENKLEHALFVARQADRLKDFFCETNCRNYSCDRKKIECYIDCLELEANFWEGVETWTL